MQSEGIFRKILLPVDEWLPSIVSQELAVFLAKKFGSSVTVLHVASSRIMIPFIERSQGTVEIEPIGAASGGFPRAVEIPKPRDNALPDDLVDEISNWYVERGERVIAEAMGRFENTGLKVEEKLVAQGDPADVILSEIEKGSYDLVIMGNSSEPERQHLGSIAKKVFAHSKIPVLITRGNVNISSVLVPVDGSENSEKALQYAEALAEKINAKITLLYVQEPPFSTLKPEISMEMGNRILDHAAGKLIDMQPESKLESGDPAKKIIETAKKANFDLIVMSSRGHGTVRRFLMGSVSDHVIHYSDRSILLIK